MQKFIRRVSGWIDTVWHFAGTSVFWRLAVGLFVVQAVYIALTGRFSMAFDEHFHLAAIQEYAKVVFPWQVTQPDGPAQLSAFTTDGSYLYHYLMSWPYRLLHVFISSQTVLIVLMRLMDVAIVTVGLFIYRRLLLGLHMSRSAAHIVLAIIMLMPMAPFMTGQLTYDSLFFTCSGVTMLAVTRLVQRVSAEHTLPLPILGWAVSTMLLTSQVKYAFLPAACGAALYVIGIVLWQAKKHQLAWPKVWRAWKLDIQTGIGLVAVGAVLLSGVLFMQRYGQNFVRYGSPVPECPVVLGHERCLGFAPYGRDADIREKGWYKTITPASKAGYVGTWLKKMIRESYFAVGPREIGYPSVSPLRVPHAVGYILVAVCLGVLLWRLPFLVRAGSAVGLLLAIIATYTLVLFAKNFQAFLSTAVPLSIHGRYMLPFLPALGYLVYVALQPLLRSVRVNAYAKLGVLLLLVASFWGGGIAVFILGSDDSWYWQSAAEISRVIRHVLSPFVLT